MLVVDEQVPERIYVSSMSANWLVWLKAYLGETTLSCESAERCSAGGGGGWDGGGGIMSMRLGAAFHDLALPFLSAGSPPL